MEYLTLKGEWPHAVEQRVRTRTSLLLSSPLTTWLVYTRERHCRREVDLFQRLGQQSTSRVS